MQEGTGLTKLPSKWMNILCDSTNKEELFAFLTTKISESIIPPGNTVYVMSGKSVLHLNIQMCLLPLQMPAKRATLQVSCFRI